MIDFNKLLILVYNGLLFIEWFLNVISIELMIAGINTFLVWVACELSPVQTSNFPWQVSGQVLFARLYGKQFFFQQFFLEQFYEPACSQRVRILYVKLLYRPKNTCALVYCALPCQFFLVGRTHEQFSWFKSCHD